ncbi:hypothetical protein BKG82_26990 [Mycobacteroides chelonae]|uniref:Uncharacterized protein n=1 Tax=Mycobacteroides chelonae TaxID=1774 RepID=A0A1S1LG59_MYCCH|nr:hypothetical protein [Mycobacteroides chelonae]OHU47300.1 hypothetical protein BKG82_26990 [Mycobacteroides chelonae]
MGTTGTSEERRSFLEGLLASALGLASTYWLEVVGHDEAADTTTIVETETGKKHVVSIKTIETGLQKVCDGQAEYHNIGYKETRNRIKLFNKANGWESDADAIDDDAILQIGIFGEVLYS